MIHMQCIDTAQRIPYLILSICSITAEIVCAGLPKRFGVPLSPPSPQKSMSTYVSDCYDSIAVFLCIHIILRFRAITAKRNIPALDKSVSHRCNENILFLLKSVCV